jgi:hypothetical protein
MKKSVVIALVTFVVALVAFSVYQAHELRKARNERDFAATEVKTDATDTQDTEAAEEKAALAEMKVRILQDTLTQSSTETAQQSEQMAALKGLLEAERTNSPEAAMVRLLSSPEMRKMMQHQQEVFLDPMIDRAYGSIFQQLGLNADQIARLKELLKQRMKAGAEKDMSMLDPNMDVSKRKELADEIKKEKGDYDELIRQLLGDEAYEEFHAYDKTIGDRNTVEQIAGQMEGGGTELNAVQREQLIQALDEERGRFKWSIDIVQLNSGTIDYSQLTDERLDQYANDREQFNAVILDRARQFLTPEQLASLEKSLALQRQMLLYSLKMQVKLMR